MQETGKIPCIKCLLKDMSQTTEYQKLKLYLDSFSKEIRVEETVYEDRLQKCRLCNCLQKGICRKCGCFVEARALRKNGHCPHEEPRW